MALDIYLCYAEENKTMAEAVAAKLESRKLRCWYADRDLPYGEDPGKMKEQAILEAPVTVVIFTEEANNRKDVLEQIGIAAKADKVIIPFRFSAVKPEGVMNFYLGPLHWLDAMNVDMEKAIDSLYGLCAANLHPEAETRIEKKEKKEQRTARLIGLGLSAALFLFVVIGFISEIPDKTFEKKMSAFELGFYIIVAVIGILAGWNSIRLYKKLKQER